MSEDIQLTLTPGAGSGIGKQLASDLLSRENFVAIVGNAFMDGLTATVKYYDKFGKKWTTEPDYKTRLAAAQAILSNLEGEPIKRVVVQDLPKPKAKADSDDSFQMLVSSPALRASLERQLAKARLKAGEIQVKASSAPSPNSA